MAVMLACMVVAEPRRGMVVAARGAAALACIAVVTCIAVVYSIDPLLAAAGRSDLREGTGAGVAFIAAMVASAAVGCALLLHRPGHPVGWCFAGLAISIAIAGGTQSYAAYGLLARPANLPATQTAAVLCSSLFIVWLVLIALVCSLTPTGHHLSPRWRRTSQVMVGAGLVWLGTALFAPGPLASPFGVVANPWGIEAIRTPMSVIRAISGTVNNLLVLAAAGSLVLRFRRAVGEERRQLLWMAIFAVPFPVLVVVAFVAAKYDNDSLVNVAAAGFVTLLPVGAGLAVSRYHLYDVDRILSRAMGYLAASLAVAGTYAVVVVLVGRAVGGLASRSPLAVASATLAAAAAARPVYTAAREMIDRRFSRRRYDALRKVRQFVEKPYAGTTVEHVLRTAVDDPALVVAYWVVDRAEWVTGAGQVTVAGEDDVVVHRGGRQVASIRHSSDPELVRSVAGEAAPELDNAGLRAAVTLQLEEVRASRARIAGAQLAERRRIERDLHDGAQQRLLALAAHLQAGLLNGSPERMAAALELGVAESRLAVTELRELANGLHPSVLSDGGLSAALDDLALRLPVRIRMDPPERRYAAQVEATAWFVVCEAVTNALKHAGPATVDVHVAHTEAFLHLTIVDDGHGGADPSGAGLRGLADRAEAAGGQLLVLAGEPVGTRVEVTLPCG
jgi:signal transduction histidine kinase